MLVATPAITTWVTPSAFRRDARSVLAKTPQVRLVRMMSSGCRSSSGTSPVQSAGRSPPRAGCSLRPGARPSTFTNTTGKHRPDRVHGGVRDNAFLQVDDQQGGVRVQDGHAHGCLLVGTEVSDRSAAVLPLIGRCAIHGRTG